MPDSFTIEKTVNYLKACVKADEIKYIRYDKMIFVDCGTNLERIICPSCGERLSFEWWGNRMDIAYQNDFKDLSIKLPCCEKESSLNKLIFDSPCGFSRWVIEIYNPGSLITKEIKDEIEKKLRENIKEIRCHY